MKKLIEKNLSLSHGGRLLLASFLLITGMLLLPYSKAFSLGSHDEAGQELSLNTALALAVQFHPMLSARQSEYQAAIADLSAAKWSRFPSAGLSLQGFKNDDDDENILNQEVLTVSQPIWTGGQLTGKISLAKAKRDAAQFSIVDAEQEILEETILAFFEVLKATERLDISLSDVAEHERLYGIIQRRVEASTSPDVDLKLARARVAFSRSQALQNSSLLETARANLEQLIGQKVNHVSPPEFDESQVLHLNEALEKGVSFSPAIKKIRLEILGLAASVKVSRSALFPQLSIGYRKRYGTLRSDQENEDVFIGLEYQTGAGLSSRSSVKSSQSRKKAMQDTLSALEREIRRKIQIIWQDLSASRLQLSPTELLVDSTSAIVESYLRQYTVGRKSWLDVLNAQRELVQARLSLVEYQTALYNSHFRLSALVGDLTKKTVVTQSE